MLSTQGHSSNQNEPSTVYLLIDKQPLHFQLPLHLR